MGHYIDHPNFLDKKYGGTLNKEGVTSTTNDSVVGSTAYTWSTGGDNYTAHLDPVKELIDGGAKTGKIFSAYLS